jgi:hypothetical protein
MDIDDTWFGFRLQRLSKHPQVESADGTLDVGGETLRHCERMWRSDDRLSRLAHAEDTGQLHCAIISIHCHVCCPCHVFQLVHVHTQDCISCCNSPFCNFHEPSNISSALYYSRSSASKTLDPLAWTTMLACVGPMLISWTQHCALLTLRFDQSRPL